MPKGRPRKHAVIHQLDGTYRHNEHDNGADTRPAVGACLPTRRLGVRGEQFFQVVLSAYPPGTLGESDSESLTRCSELVEVHFAIQEKWDRQEYEPEQYLKATAESNRQFLQYAVRFGLTPADKGKVKLSPVSEEENKSAKFFGATG